MLTNTNAALAPNTERLRSQSADVISADFLFLTWLNTRHRIVVKKSFLFFFFLSLVAIGQEKYFCIKC